MADLVPNTIQVFDQHCTGCFNNKRYAMLSLDVEGVEYVDVFLTQDQVKTLIIDLINLLGNSESNEEVN